MLHTWKYNIKTTIDLDGLELFTDILLWLLWGNIRMLEWVKQATLRYIIIIYTHERMHYVCRNSDTQILTKTNFWSEPKKDIESNQLQTLPLN